MLRPNAESGLTVRDTYGDFITDAAGNPRYIEPAVMIGRWLDGGRIEWDLSDYILNDPAKSTRGCVEPTLAQVPDGPPVGGRWRWPTACTPPSSRPPA